MLTALRWLTSRLSRHPSPPSIPEPSANGTLAKQTDWEYHWDAINHHLVELAKHHPGYSFFFSPRTVDQADVAAAYVEWLSTTYVINSLEAINTCNWAELKRLLSGAIMRVNYIRAEFDLNGKGGMHHG